jgi:hypothetical protein
MNVRDEDVSVTYGSTVLWRPLRAEAPSINLAAKLQRLRAPQRRGLIACGEGQNAEALAITGERGCYKKIPLS